MKGLSFIWFKMTNKGSNYIIKENQKGRVSDTSFRNMKKDLYVKEFNDGKKIAIFEGKNFFS